MYVLSTQIKNELPKHVLIPLKYDYDLVKIWKINVKQIGYV